VQRESADRPAGLELFRPSAVEAASQRHFGGATIVVPPSAPLAFVMSFTMLAALAIVAVVVEVPVRVRAIGVLMPPGGMLNVVAIEAGVVRRIHAAEGQSVRPDQLLLEVAANGSNAAGESLAALHLRSLKRELTLQNDAYRMQRQIDDARVVTLRADRIAALRRATVGRRRLEAHREEFAIRELRFNRLRALAENEFIAREAFELEHATLIRTRAEGEQLEQDAIDLEAAVHQVERSIAIAQAELDLAAAKHEVAAQRLGRDIESGTYRAFQDVRAPAEGVVARVLVATGTPVRKGQVLAKLYRRLDDLEAWLYVSSSSARLLRTGQTVQLKLDAYATEMFGTLSATVTSVSGIALRPEELDVPLALGGPVFEIRASLARKHLHAYGAQWPLPPGTSFGADLIQHRARLYRWLIRSLLGQSDGAPV
jgi:membrane fusion protein